MTNPREVSRLLERGHAAVAVGSEDLDRDLAIECRVPASIHSSECAGTERLEEDDVPPVPCAGKIGGNRKIGVVLTQSIGSMRIDNSRDAAHLPQDLPAVAIIRLLLEALPVNRRAVGHGGTKRDEPGIFRRVAQHPSPRRDGRARD